MAGGVKLHAVWAISADDVFAVGDHGTILRRNDGTDWTAMSSGTTSDLLSVWAWSSSDVWVGSTSGTILHFNGASWSQIIADIPRVDSIWGSSASNVYFVGSTQVLRWNGSSLSAVISFGGTLLSVSGTGPNDVWVTGEVTNLHRYNGTAWANSASSVGNSMWAILAIATNDVWASSMVPGRDTSHYNGSRWITIKTSPLASTGALFHSLSAEAANDVWGVGNSKIGHWNGTAWSLEEPFGSGQALWSISTLPGHAWIVGDGGLIAHRAL